MPFFDDDFPDGLLFGTAVTSREPVCGPVERYTIPPLPNGYSAVTAADIPGENSVRVGAVEMPLLADSEVTFIGQPFVLLCGPDPDILDDIAARCAVAISGPGSDERTEERPPASTYFTVERTVGDPVQGFTGAAHTIEGEYLIRARRDPPLDSPGALAIPENGGVSVRSPSLWPYHVRRAVSGTTGLQLKHVKILPASVGTRSFDRSWIPSFTASFAALLALKAGKPVRFRRNGLFRNRMPGFHMLRIAHSTAMKSDGNLSAMEVEISLDSGAYPLFADEMMRRLVMGAIGAYSCPNIRISGSCMRSDNPPVSAFGLPGIAEATFAMEIHATRLAELAQKGPAAWKRDNLSPLFPRDPKNRGDLFKTVQTLSDFSRKHAAYEMLRKRRTDPGSLDMPLRGIGIAASFQVSDFLVPPSRETNSVRVRLDTSGEVTIFTSAVRSKHTELVWQAAAASLLGADAGMTAVVDSDTDTVPDSGPSVLSRGMTTVRRLIEQSCQTVAGRRFRSPLPLEERKGTRPPSVGNTEPFIGPSPTTRNPVAYVVTVVEVEIDPVSYSITDRGVWMCVKAGPILDRGLAALSIEADVLELLIRLRGLPLEGGGISPPVITEFLDDERSPSAGIGTLAEASVPAAWVSAVSQATGLYIDRYPVTPEMIYEYRMSE